MTVNDLRENMECTIISTKKDKKYESRSVIRIIEKDVVYVDVTIYKGQVINLSGVSNHLVIEQKNTEPQIFQHIHPDIYKKGGKKYYRIDLKGKTSVHYNRRHNARVNVGKTVSVRADNTAETYNCSLKDVSAVGFALEFANRNLPPNYKDIKVFRFIFTDIDRVKNIKVTTELRGAVRRIVKSGEDKTLFGCQIPYSYPIDQYVSRKTKLKLK